MDASTLDSLGPRLVAQGRVEWGRGSVTHRERARGPTRARQEHRLAEHEVEPGSDEPALHQAGHSLEASVVGDVAQRPLNDNRVTMGSRWGQGAQSALPIVGEFFRQAIKARVVDQTLRFAAPHDAGVVEPVQLDANDQPSLEADLSAEKMTQKPLGVDAGALPEGSWQPAPGIRYITVPGPAGDVPKTEGEPGTIVPRDLQPPDRR